ncbi:MAG: vanadium-dependent haloperoxidase [Pseudomonadota bacterium]
MNTIDPRQKQANEIRKQATEIASSRVRKPHLRNGEEQDLGGYDPNCPHVRQRQRGGAIENKIPYLTFSKGLAHDDETGLPTRASVLNLRKAINQKKVDDFNDIGIAFKDTSNRRFFSVAGQTSIANGFVVINGRAHRRWEAPTAGYVFDLQGPDAQAVTMPPAPRAFPRAGRTEPDAELVADMAEVYWFGLLRDVPFSHFKKGRKNKGNYPATPSGVDVGDAINYLKKLDFYKKDFPRYGAVKGKNYGAACSVRPHADTLSAQNIFRGQTPGDQIGPYISQFLLIGNDGAGGADDKATDGLIKYGSIRIDQRVREAKAHVDYMTVWNEYLDVQDGANVSRTQKFVSNPNSAGGAGDNFRFIATPRDLATYVHFDALYEAYLNACLWLLSAGAPLDPDFKKVAGEPDGAVEGFALYGGPHILSLVTEVATRALKAVRYQKFQNHLRLRPEALAGLLAAEPDIAKPTVDPLIDALKAPNGRNVVDLLAKVQSHNQAVNSKNRKKMGQYLAAQSQNPLAARDDLPLLPMAFPEGSPMHPTYGAGHATVAGACVTMLKAFFDEDAELRIDKDGKHIAIAPNDPHCDGSVPFAYEAIADGTSLCNVYSKKADALTVGDELNKLASNISIGRNVAGVHYYSDYIQSLVMGEEIAIGVLKEQAVTYTGTEDLKMTFESFTGKSVQIRNPNPHISILSA